MNKRTFLKLLTGTVATVILPTKVLATYHANADEDAVKKILYNLVKGEALFKMNEAVLRKRIYNNVNFYLTETALVYDHFVICDETVNSVNVIDRNEFHMDVALQFKEYEEFVYFSIIIKNTRQSFLSLL